MWPLTVTGRPPRATIDRAGTRRRAATETPVAGLGDADAVLAVGTVLELALESTTRTRPERRSGAAKRNPPVLATVPRDRVLQAELPPAANSRATLWPAGAEPFRTTFWPYSSRRD